MNSDQNEDSFSLPKLINTLGRKPMVLCVEDNEINAMLVKEILNDYCTIFHVTNGEEAVISTCNSLFDLILMDINLGDGMNGIETSRMIRNRPEYQTVPVAAVTGYLATLGNDEMMDAGIEYHLAKPFARFELLNLIQNILIKSIYSAPGSLPEVPIGAP